MQVNLFFSNSVEKALNDIYYNVRTGRGKEAFALLEKASAAGDGDASCVLARCLSGAKYVWDGHGFPVDHKRASELLKLSVQQESALGVLMSLRSGELSPELEKDMPFSDLMQAFDIVRQKAEMGDPLCQYALGNVYFWGDYLRIEGKSEESFSSEDEYQAYLKEQTEKCEQWFWQAFMGGVHFAGNNLHSFYANGKENLIAPQPDKAATLWKTGAECGYPVHQFMYAEDLQNTGNLKEALEWYKKAASGGEIGAWFRLGCMYNEGSEAVPADLAAAASCYEKELQLDFYPEAAVALTLLAYRENAQQVDPSFVFQWAKAAYDQGEQEVRPYLVYAYLQGVGTTVSCEKAYELFCELSEEQRNDPKMLYTYGLMCLQGNGVEQDIKKGVECLKQAEAEYPPAKQELTHYKRTLFGKWVRKD